MGRQGAGRRTARHLTLSCIAAALAAGLRVPSAAAQPAFVGGEVAVHAAASGGQGAPAVAADAGGSFVVVWTSFSTLDGSGMGVVGRRFDRSGEPQGGEFRVDTDTPSTGAPPAVASDAAGNFVVVWHGRNDLFQYDIFARRFDRSGSAIGAQFTVNAYTTSRPRNPTVAADPAGNFLVAWEGYYGDGSHGDIFARVYDPAGQPRGTVFQVNSYTTAGQGEPVIAA